MVVHLAVNPGTADLHINRKYLSIGLLEIPGMKECRCIVNFFIKQSHIIGTDLTDMCMAELLLPGITQISNGLLIAGDKLHIPYDDLTCFALLKKRLEHDLATPLDNQILS